MLLLLYAILRASSKVVPEPMIEIQAITLQELAAKWTLHVCLKMIVVRAQIDSDDLVQNPME